MDLSFSLSPFSLFEYIPPGAATMPFLYSEITFCDCGRPALPDSGECRTCYEDAYRRRWRDESRFQESRQAPVPVVLAQAKMIKPRLRPLYAPAMSEEDLEREMCEAPA
jgi:hypothetical protein